MRKLIYITFFFSMAVYGQVLLNPEVMSYPDISQEAQNAYTQLKNRYDVITKTIETVGENAVSEEDLEFWRNSEMKIIDGSPFNTGVEGCSWYCGATIKNVEASYSLKNSAISTYDAWNAHDFDLKTAWATSKNKGLNEKLTFRFTSSENLYATHVEVYNGYQKSEETWKNNSRAKKLEVFINGKSTYILNLMDTLKMQKFSIGERFSPPDDNLVIEFKVLEIYPGEKYQDLCISEINFDGEGDH